VITCRIKRNRWRRRRTGQHSEMITEEQRNKSKRNPPAISIHRYCPLTYRTRDKEIKKTKQKQRKKQREKVQKNKRNARLELSSSLVSRNQPAKT